MGVDDFWKNIGANKRYLATHGKNFLLGKKYIDLGRVQISPDSTIGYNFTSLNLARCLTDTHDYAYYGGTDRTIKERYYGHTSDMRNDDKPGKPSPDKSNNLRTASLPSITN